MTDESDPLGALLGAANTFRQIRDFDEAKRFMDMSPFLDQDAALKYLVAGLLYRATKTDDNDPKREIKNLASLLDVPDAIASHICSWIVVAALIPDTKDELDDAPENTH